MSFPFSNRTLTALARAIAEALTHTTMDTLFYECSLQQWEDPGASSKLAKALNLLKAVQSDGSPAACNGARELMTEMLKLGGRRSETVDDFGSTREPPDWYRSLSGALLADGLEFDESGGTLVPAVQGAEVVAEVSWLEADLARRGWGDALGHYEQALDNFGKGNWAASALSQGAVDWRYDRRSGAVDGRSLRVRHRLR